MKSRILSLAAIAGMLVATGCSGGGAGVTGVNAPVAPPTGGTPAKGTSSISASFLIPEAAITKATASNGRTAKYLSPGTGGLDILLGNGAPFSNSAGASGNAQTSGASTDNATYPSPPGGVGAANVVSILTGSYQNGTQAVVGQTLRLIDQASIPGTTYVSATFTVSNVQAGGTVLNGTFNSVGANAGYSAPSNTYNAAAGVPNTPPVGFTPIPNPPGGRTFPAGSLAFFTQIGGAANGQQFLVGSQAQPAAFTYAALAPGSVSGTVPAAVTQGTAGTFNYTFTPSTQHGYYVFTFTATGLNAATAYTLGVVTFDYNNKYVLSQNQAVITTPAGGGTNNVAFTLRPVVANVYVPAPLPVFPNPDGSTAAAPSAATNTLETTVFATDEMGYVIENQSLSVTGQFPDNLPIAGIAAGQGSIIKIAATTAANLTFQKYGPLGQTSGGPVVFKSITQSPFGVAAPIATIVANSFSIGNNNAAASDVPAINFAGNFLAMATPTAPFTITPGGTFSAGNALNVVCNTNTSVPWGATLTSAAPGTANNANAATNTVIGYTINPGVNYPANGATVIALPAVNCVPGIGGVIN